MHNRVQSQVLFYVFMTTLLLAFSIGCLLLAAWLRYDTGRNMYTFLRWDMFLAWVPLIVMGAFIMMQRIDVIKGTVLRKLLSLLIFAVWLAFYPNSAYLVTDALHVYIHYKIEPGVRFAHEIEFWLHHLLFLFAALIGLALGSYSLYILHQQLNERWNKVFNWSMIVAILLLSSIGIYIGRFIRWNSWDLVLQPITIVTDSVEAMTTEANAPLFAGFTVLFFLLQLLSYMLFYVVGQYGKNKQ